MQPITEQNKITKYPSLVSTTLTAYYEEYKMNTVTSQQFCNMVEYSKTQY